MIISSLANSIMSNRLNWVEEKIHDDLSYHGCASSGLFHTTCKLVDQKLPTNLDCRDISYSTLERNRLVLLELPVEKVTLY